MSKLTRLATTFALVSLAAAATTVATAVPAGALTTYTVTTTVDGGAGSLRQAIADAAGDADESVINLQAGVEYVLSDCTAGGGDLDHGVAQLLTINGNGSTIRQSCAGERVLELSGSTTTINRTVIRGGNLAAGDGGGIASAGTVTIFDSEIRDNSAVNGGGVFSTGSVNTDRSALIGNTATSAGGAIAVDVTADIASTTVAGNTALFAAAADGTDIVLTNATVAGNTTTGAGNSDIESDTLVSRGSAVGDSLGVGTACGAIAIGTTSNGNNADDDGTCGFTALTDHANVPSLGLLPLAGTAPRYRLPSTTSVLLNTVATAECLSDDQRQVPRPQVTGGLCEIGAVEVQLPTVTDDSYTVSGATALAVRANDTDPDNRVAPGTMTVSIAPGQGTATVQADFTVLYTPNPGFNGLDAFTYKLCGAGEPVDLCQTGTVALTVITTSRFTPLPPARVFDTRPGETAPGPKGFVNAGTSIDVQITGVADVPATGVSAVVLNVTATEAGGAGFVTVWPTGQTRPNASNLNLVAAGQTAPNLVTVPIGAGGKVSLFTQSGAHLLADVAGYYTSALTATSGRLVPLDPARIFDSRPGTTESGPKGLVGEGQRVAVQVAGVGGVPATGVSAVVLNVTGTEAAADGFVTVWPGGSDRPTASSLNLTAGQSTPNLVTVGLGADGTVNLFSQAGAHLVVDVTGYYTDGSAPSSGVGLFVPLNPGRVSDTRAGTTDPGPKGLVAGQSLIDVQVSGVVGIPAGAAAAVLNLTATEAVAAGFVTGWPAGGTRPNASNLNLNSPGETRPNAAILRLSPAGQISLFSQSGTHLVVDTSGYFTG